MKADLDIITKKIQGDANRSSLKEGLSFKDEQEKVLKEREPKYKAAADMEINTSELSIEEAVKKILKNI